VQLGCVPRSEGAAPQVRRVLHRINERLVRGAGSMSAFATYLPDDIAAFVARLKTVRVSLDELVVHDWEHQSMWGSILRYRLTDIRLIVSDCWAADAVTRLHLP